MKCKGCMHRRSLSGTQMKDGACHYLIDTDEPRGCSAEECYARKIHYVAKRSVRNKEE